MPCIADQELPHAFERDPRVSLEAFRDDGLSTRPLFDGAILPPGREDAEREGLALGIGLGALDPYGV